MHAILVGEEEEEEETRVHVLLRLIVYATTKLISVSRMQKKWMDGLH